MCIFAIEDLTHLVVFLLRSYIKICDAEHLWGFDVKLPSCGNYITICKWLSKFQVQIYEIPAVLRIWLSVHVEGNRNVKFNQYHKQITCNLQLDQIQTDCRLTVILLLLLSWCFEDSTWLWYLVPILEPMIWKATRSEIAQSHNNSSHDINSNYSFL